MKKKKAITKTIIIPEGASISLDGNLLKVKGSKGEVENRFAFPNVKINLVENKLIINSKYNTRKFKRIINTFYSQINNMLRGIETPYICKLKICSGHFPMKVTQDQNKIVISNFLGEKISRKAAILKNVSVKIDSDTITLTGSDKAATTQSAANIEKATRITNRDRRIFQDGIFLMK